MISLKPFDLIGKFWQDKNLGLIFRWNLIFIIFEIILLALKYKDLPLNVPFYYSLPWGEARLAPVNYLILFPVISAFFLFLNNFLAAVLLLRSRLFSFLLSIGSLVASIFLLYSLFQIISLVS